MNIRDSSLKRLDPPPASLQKESIVAKHFSEQLVAELEQKNFQLQRQTDELRAAREQFNSFFRAATVGLAILDSQLRFVQINDTLAAINGLPAKHHLGKTIHEIIPDPAPKLEKIFRRVLETSKPILDLEVSGVLPSKPGIMRHWLASYFPIKLGESQGIGAIISEITQQKQGEAELHRSREQLRALAAHLHVIREQESTRISREIHDILGQNLTSLNLDVEWLKNYLTVSSAVRVPSAVRKRLNSMETLLQTTCQTVQRIASDLRPGILDDLGLAATLVWAAEDWAHRAGIRCHWKRKPQPMALSREQATALFRIFQEILTNISRHARARNVTCSFKSTARELTLQITDDGKGFNPGKVPDRKSLGLIGMRERALLFAGHLEIQSAPGQGTTVTIRIPLGSASWTSAGDAKSPLP